MLVCACRHEESYAPWYWEEVSYSIEKGCHPWWVGVWLKVFTCGDILCDLIAKAMHYEFDAISFTVTLYRQWWSKKQQSLCLKWLTLKVMTQIILFMTVWFCWNWHDSYLQSVSGVLSATSYIFMPLVSYNQSLKEVPTEAVCITSKKL